MHLRLLVLPFLLVPFAPIACSADDPPPETREHFCDRWADAACNRDVVSFCQASSADDCRLSQERFCLSLVPASGFVDDHANDCIDAVGAAYGDADLTVSELETVLRLGAPCDQLVRGSRTEGGSCTSRFDCDAPGGFDCVFKGSEASGTCQLPETVSPGRDCAANNAVCTDGFYCDGDNCIEGKDTGEACTRDAECADGYCGPDRVCVAGLAVGTDCSEDAECASGLCYLLSGGQRVCTDRVRLSRTDPACEDLR
jgi:hypothetical protein